MPSVVRVISIVPAVTMNMRVDGSPGSIRTSPRSTRRRRPRAAMREICAGVSVG
jgi:hypothetical protein